MAVPTISDDGLGGCDWTPAFAGEADRARLTPTGLKAYRALVARWTLSNRRAAALLGVSSGAWRCMKAGSWKGVLTRDQFTRISALLSIFDELHNLFGEPMADRWPTLVNHGELFAHCTPVDTMINGGILVMQEIRRHVGALQQGL